MKLAGAKTTAHQIVTIDLRCNSAIVGGLSNKMEGINDSGFRFVGGDREFDDSPAFPHLPLRQPNEEDVVPIAEGQEDQYYPNSTENQHDVA